VLTYNKNSTFSIFNHIKRPSQLSNQSDYSYFKHGIKPMWEDDKNSAGGRWVLKLPPVKKNLHIDEYWKNIVRNKLYFSIYFY